ncbi:MAG: DUF1614 domain-containing protein [Candidatus Binataceae bacterium]
MLLSRAMFFGPFLILYALVFFAVLAGLFVLIEIGVIHYAFQMIGLPPDLAFLALAASLIGAYINIPLIKIEGGATHTTELVNNYGVRYRVPVRYTGGTMLAVNVGGAVVPVLISLYVLVRQPGTVIPAIIGVAIVALLVHRWARPVPGMGIATPMFIPPIVAAICAWVLAGIFGAHHIDGIAYVSGVLGTLIGADIANINKLGDLGAPVASIGGAGTFDGVFLTGIVAVLLA